MAQLKLGLIGLGALGSRIATRLLRTGFSLEIYDIADVAVRTFNMDVGGIITCSPKMMAQACEVIITVLPSAADVREVAFGWESLARGFAKGGVLIDMGCSDPIATSGLAAELAGRGIDMVDAPAVGTSEDAKAGKLTFVAVEQRSVAGQMQNVNHFRLLGNNTVDLWYDAGGRLVRQEWTEQGHRTLLELARARR